MPPTSTTPQQIIIDIIKQIGQSECGSALYHELKYILNNTSLSQIKNLDTEGKKIETHYDNIINKTESWADITDLEDECNKKTTILYTTHIHNKLKSKGTRRGDTRGGSTRGGSTRGGGTQSRSRKRRNRN